MNFEQLVADLNAQEPEPGGRVSTKPGIPASQLRGLTGPRGAGPMLREGEVSSTLRVRMPDAQIAAWWASLSAYQRGVIVTAAHQLLSAKPADE